MKKLFTILLIVSLVVFSFVGCEKDKSEEVIKNYEDFIKTEKAMTTFVAIANKLSSSPGKTEISAKSISKDDLADVVFLANKEKITVTEILDAKGTIQSEINNDEKNESLSASVKVSGIEIKYKYTTSKEKEPKESTLTLNGTLLNNSKSVSGESTEKKANMTFTTSGLVINGTAYKDITFNALISEEDSKVTSATVDGKTVDIRLINANGSILD